MNLNRRLEIIGPALSKATDSANARFDLEHSPVSMKVRQSDHEYAQRIMTAMAKLESVEDMVFFEQSLQKSDFLKANSKKEVWDARIAMAKKTGDMFKALHSSLAADFGRNQK